jgi:hypothetical protein
LINGHKIDGSARVQQASARIVTTAAWQQTTMPGCDSSSAERETNMLRKTILALAATAAIGVTTLPATDASAHWYGGWHRGGHHYGWHRH